MPDREKVIKGLDCCSHTDGVNCIYCPYDNDGEDCTALMSMDVLELLKEKKAVNKNTGQWKNGHCSCCGEDISSMLDTWTNIQNFLFCPKCGAKMEE